ncbi:MAG TPA: VOC family protein [Candidatus Sulfotelmatobacter sp.]
MASSEAVRLGNAGLHPPIFNSVYRSRSGAACHACGRGGAARGFYGTLLGKAELKKPPELTRRGGCWFESGSVQLHLGVDADSRPAKKAHPALRCRDYDELTARLHAAGVEVSDDPSTPGVRRCHLSDPFGNRIELIGS